ncbi:MAG: hypothetical protein R2883_03980 [Caldisericia bacterium]
MWNYITLFVVILLTSILFRVVPAYAIKAASYSLTGVPLAFIVILLVSTLSVFFVFIPYEAVFNDGSFGSLMSNAFKKAIKVYWKLFILTFVIWALFYLVAWIFGISTFALEMKSFERYFEVSLGTVFVIFSMIFIYYPLYKNATELLWEKNEEPQKIEETDIRVHKTEYIGSDNYVFHKTTCFHVKQIAPGTEDYFETREEAIEKGYDPCKHCRP